MFFLVGGVQPKTIVLDETPRLCPVCGLAQAKLRRVDHYLSLFFIPLFLIKRGQPVLICDRCEAVSSPDQPLESPPAAADATHCLECGYPLAEGFHYCPQCGNRI